MDPSKNLDVALCRDFLFGVTLNIIEKSNILLKDLVSLHREGIVDLLPIIDFILNRIDTIAQLTQQEKLVDAEIIFRSMLESFIKYFYILSSDNKEIKLNEFWHNISQINILKTSIKARKFLKLKDPSLPHIILKSIIISEQKEQELRNKYMSKDNRNQTVEKLLNNNWAFNNILSYIENNYKGRMLWDVLSMSYTWGNATHMAHGDEMALNHIQSRALKQGYIRSMSDLYQSIRIMRNIAVYSVWTASLLSDHLKLPSVDSYYTDTRQDWLEIRKLNELVKAEVEKNPAYDEFRDSSTPQK